LARNWANKNIGPVFPQKKNTELGIPYVLPYLAASRQQCLALGHNYSYINPSQSQGEYIQYIAGLRGPVRWGTSNITPISVVLAGEVRSAAAWPGITKKTTEYSDHTHRPCLHKQYFQGWLVISPVRRGGSGIIVD
jgi:hypothetical protein